MEEIKEKKLSIEGYDADNVWFTSDTHFGHENIIRFCNRPFKNVDEMDEHIVNQWNSVVKPDDHVFHLGDFCFKSKRVWLDYIERLNGKIHLILGNHDSKMVFNQNLQKHFEEITFQKVINIDQYKIYLNHFPFLCFDCYNDHVFQLFGHIHSVPDMTKAKGLDIDRMIHLFSAKQYDVGVDNNNFTPVKWSQILKELGYNESSDNE